MKRGTPDHPKTADLAVALGIELYAAGGLLEFLWLWSQKYAIRGDIGKWPNSTIARGIHWPGDPDALIRALIETRWVDEAPDPFRLVVHDVRDHADNSWRQCLDDAELTWWDGSPARKPKGGYSNKTPVKLQKTSPSLHSLPFPSLHTTRTEQYPEGEDLRNPPPPQPALPINNSEFEAWIEPWPRCANPDEAARAWISVMTADQLVPATACRDRYLGSREVADGAVMEPAKFIFAQFKCRWSGKWIAAKNGNGKKSQLDEMAERVLVDMEREEREKCQRQ